MPKLSVIVTCYNIAPYLAQCLDSVTGQTLQDIEIIVVDDGSTDATPQIIRDHAARDPRIRPILFEANTIGGVATAANAGMDAATGDYIGFADGDDYVEPRMFERLYEEAERAGRAHLAMCRYLLEDETTGQQSPPADARLWEDVRGVTTVELDDAARREALRFVAVPWRKIYRRDWVQEHGLRFPVGDYFFEDNPLHWMALLSADRLVLVPEVLCYHRVARIGQTMETADEKLFRMFDHHETIHGWITEHGHEAAHRIDLLAWATSQLEWIGPRTPPELQGRLYDAVLPVFSHYDAADVEMMLLQNRKGMRAHAMTAALLARSREDFLAALAETPKNRSLISKGLHGLRHNGLRDTAALTGRYLRDRMRERGLPSRRGKSLTDTDDLLFAMAVLQRRLEAIEAKLEAATAPRAAVRAKPDDHDPAGGDDEDDIDASAFVDRPEA